MSNSHRINKPLAVALILSIIALLFIWFTGPYLPFNKMIGLLLVPMLWAAFGIYWTLRNILLKPSSTLPDPKKTQTLQTHCNQAWAFIKKHPGKKGFGILPRPWILLLGTPQSGKTSLLSGTTRTLTSPHQTSLTSIKPTHLVDWWVSDDAVFIDPTSRIALPTNETDKERWNRLIEIINRYRLTRPVNHVLLVIDLPSVLHESQETIRQLSTQLKNVQALAKTIPVSLVISKCDELPGFSELFDDLNADERQQIFGIQTQASHFTTEFSALITRLKTRLIHRLHREQSLEKRQRIFAFPQQFSSLSKPLETLITTLAFHDKMPLHGIYFTSTRNQRAYFIDAMIQSTIQIAQKPLPSASKNTMRRILALPMAAAILCGLTFLWHMSYQQSIQITNNVQEAIATPPSNIPSNLPWLSALQIQSNVLDTIRQQQILHYRWLGLSQIYHLYRAAHKNYDTLLTSQFLRHIKSTLLSQIQLGIKGDKLALFDALKTYLSTTQQQHYDKNIIMNWYRTYWKAAYPNDLMLQGTLQHHLFALLESDTTLWRPDNQLIKQAQTILKKLPLADLAFLELQGEYKAINESIFPKGKLEGVSLKNATVPSFFSTRHFKDIFNQKIPHINDTIEKGSWVLGIKKGKTITPKQQSEITQKIRSMYLQYYTNTWAGTVENIQLMPASTVADTLQRINILLDQKSELSQLLKLIVGQASLDKGTTNKSLSTIKDYLNKKGHYASIQTSLHALKKALLTLQKSHHPGKASYLMAIKRFQTKGYGDPISQLFQEASKNPEPIQSWLNTIAKSSWKILLDQTQTYLNTVWQTVVLPVYNSEIKQRYPIFTDSDNNISLKNFNDFFGPNGTIGAFFIYYLQPFVNMTKNYWTWQSLNGMTLNIPQKTLNMFIRASVIQQMFFTDKKGSPNFEFVLLPLKLSGNAKKFTLNLGGQIHNLSHQTQQTMQHFFWPAKDPNFITIQFITTDNKNPTATYHGPWAWFRLLDANTLHTTADPKQFTLTIQQGSNAANFKVIAKHRVNPMVPGVIGKFRCPDKL